MKKLLLTALAIIGLAGSSAQGAAAAVAGFAAKAGSFLQKAALPALVGQVMYDAHGYLHPHASQVDLTGVHSKIDALAGAIKPVLKLPFVVQAVADAADATPSTWYGKAWKSVVKFDGWSDTVLSKIQKIMLILSIFSGAQTYAHNQVAKMQPQPVQEVQENIAVQQPVQPVIFKKHRRHRRSGIAARA